MLATAVALVGGATAAYELSSARSARAVARLTVGAITATVPTGHHYRYFKSCSYLVTGSHGACVHGVVIADYHLRPQPEIGAPGARYPQTGVALELYQAPKHDRAAAATARFPVSLRDFHFVGRGVGGPSKSQSELFFRVGGRNYWAIAWAGTKSTASQRGQHAALVSSIRPT
jgi:hypothetical protein